MGDPRSEGGRAASPEPGDRGGSEDGDGTVVRRYRSGDERAVRRVFERAMTAAGTDPADVPGTRDLGWVEAAYIEPGGEFLVVEPRDGRDECGRVVATGGLVVDEDVGELFRVAVDPDHQRRGYGSRLLSGLENAARERGVERLVLTTARRQDAAVAFYSARGYELTGRDTHGEYDLLRFAKRLGHRD